MFCDLVKLLAEMLLAALHKLETVLQALITASVFLS
jgi:hypothetical protein